MGEVEGLGTPCWAHWGGEENGEQGWRSLLGSWVGIRESGVISGGPQGRISSDSQRKRISRGSPRKEWGQWGILGRTGGTYSDHWGHGKSGEQGWGSLLDSIRAIWGSGVG